MFMTKIFFDTFFFIKVFWNFFDPRTKNNAILRVFDSIEIYVVHLKLGFLSMFCIFAGTWS